ncbi:uncharacterized protein LOC122382829 isoform X3 [Amphibalanus amphitrite]|uniref:uncharacterized protein LOC122382829 isoform X3 n=1 Tax=Amphibalanus amphitrite TaxID=1232801 RepID=UPI001C8FEF84|nr:uncharacterized protein LOC122382829 isoform X3 [Amphibalanus amphitrite]
MNLPAGIKIKMTETRPSLAYVVQWTEHDAVVHRCVRVRLKTEILVAAINAFSIREGTFALELHYPDFDVFVRVDDFEDLPDSGRLRLVKLPGSDDTISTVSTADTVPILGLDISGLDKKDAATSELTSVAPPSAAVLLSGGGDGPEADDSERDKNDEGNSTEVIDCPSTSSNERDTADRHSRSRQAPIWTRVKARLSTACQVALQQDDALSEKHWSDLMQALYDEATKTSFYPGRNQYLGWATDLVETSGKAVWKKKTMRETIECIRAKIRAKFKNTRFASSDAQLTEERTSKHIKLSTASKDHQAAAGLPAYDPGLDSPSEAQLQDMYLLKNQFETLSEDRKKELKESTFAVRRWYLLKTREPLERLKDRFPWLFSEEEVWEEFDRVTCESKRTDALLVVDKVFRGLQERFFTRSDEETKAAFFDIAKIPGCAEALKVGEPAVIGTAIVVAGTKIECTTIQRSLVLWAVVHTVLCQAELRGDRATLLGLLQRLLLGVTERASRSVLKKVDSLRAYLDL